MSYERSIPLEDFALYISQQCFFNLDGTILLNYKNINCLYFTCHLLCLHQIEGIPYIPYRPLRQEDITALYESYVAIALGQYRYEVNEEAKMIAVPDNKKIPSWIFDIVAKSIDLHRL